MGIVLVAASSLGDNVLTNEQSKLDADAGKPDALSADFIARCNVMKARQITALHA